MIIDNRYYRIKSIFGYRLRALKKSPRSHSRPYYSPHSRRLMHTDDVSTSKEGAHDTYNTNTNTDTNTDTHNTKEGAHDTYDF